jgi:hypothetical protein
MTIEHLRQAHEARPFIPFALVIADGERVPVPHPESLAHPGKGRVVIVFDKDARFRVIDLTLVSMIDFDLRRREGRRKAG